MRVGDIHTTVDIHHRHGSDLTTNRQYSAVPILDESYNAVFATLSCAETVSTWSAQHIDSSFLIVFSLGYMERFDECSGVAHRESNW